MQKAGGMHLVNSVITGNLVRFRSVEFSMDLYHQCWSVSALMSHPHLTRKDTPCPL